jgi:hypothetical protein
MVTMLLLFLVYEASSFVDTTGMANAYHALIFVFFSSSLVQLLPNFDVKILTISLPI